MPAPRYEDWHHTRFEGDVDAAKALLPLARKVLGFTVQQAAFNGMQTYKHVVPLPGGGEIVGEVNGGIPRVTVFVPPPQPGREPVFPPEDFVVWSRSGAYPIGLDPEHPQQILKPPGGNGDDGAGPWTTYWFNAGITGYDAFTGRKSTYQPLFTKGLRRAGNLDWRGSKRQRIQWYGPSTRYWIEPYVQMWAQYGTAVFMAGQVVLDTPQYIADSAPKPGFEEQYVLGAGIRGMWLYVVQCQAHHIVDPVPNPGTDYGPGLYLVNSLCYSVFDVDTVVCRYRLIPHPDGSPGYRVSSGSREVLWSGAITRGVAPYFFNPDCTEAMSFLPPEVLAYGGPWPAPEASGIIRVLRIAFDEDDEPTVTWDNETASIPGGAGQAPIAGDYLEDGSRVYVEVRRRDVGGSGLGNLRQRFDILCGGAEVEIRDLYRITTPVRTNEYWDTRRWLMWADAREGVLVTRRQETFFLASSGGDTSVQSLQIWLEVWVKGERVVNRTDGQTTTDEGNNSFGIWPVYSNNNNGGLDNNLANPIAPLMPIYAFNYQMVAWDFYISTMISPAHAGYCYFPRQPGVCFGYVLYGRVVSGGVDVPAIHRIVVDAVNAPPGAEKLDEDGKDSVLGAAASEGVVLLSAYPKAAGFQPADHVVIPEDGPQLPDLTGVPGPLERYHPIWLLGRPPPAITP